MKLTLRCVSRITLCLLSAALLTVLLSSSAFSQSGFSRKIITFTSPCGVAFENPTTLAMRPDGRLFVGQQNGMIFMLTLDAQLNVTSVKCVDAIYNRDKEHHRLLTGMAFGPYFAGPAGIGPDLYVSHSDGRICVPEVDLNSGTVTKLLASSGYQTGVDVVTGLPRSRGDHAPNGLALGPDGLLYLAVGGNTNAGLPGGPCFDIPEVPKGGAILKLDYSGAVSTYATGLRNTYDLVWHTNGQLYANDNGPNAGLGNAPDPATCGPPGFDPGNLPDELNRIVAGRYYGHPNPSRGECVHNGGPNYVAPMHHYGVHTSSNGLAEYTDSLIPGFQGNLFTANWGTGEVIRIQLSPDGKTVTSAAVFSSGYGNPIDVAANADTFFIAEYGPDQITALRWIHITDGARLGPRPTNALTRLGTH